MGGIISVKALSVTIHIQNFSYLKLNT